MSDEPEAYRPRRAWRDEQSSAAESATPDSGPTDRPIESDDGGPPAETQPAADGVADPKADHDADAEVPDAGAEGTEAADPEDVPPPLYRDESTAVRSPRSGDDTTPDRGLSDETTILSRARERKRSRAERDPDATTLLPRTAGGSRVPQRDDDADDDDPESDPSADRRRLLLMIGAVAVVAILGLVGGYAIIKTTGQPIAAPGPSTSPGPTDPGTTPSGETSDPGTALITDDLMLSAAQAETIDKKRTWKVALTQRGTTEDSPHHPACLATDVTEGAPPPQQTVLRLLSSNGSDSPAALHQATSYGSPEEAAQAYAFAARSLGNCSMTGGWIYQGHLVGGVGDQAVGVTIQVLDGSTTEYRTVVLTRTGRIVDVIDVAKPDKAVTAKRVAEVAGSVVDTQCQAAGGACSDEPEAQDGPPPLGGDQPGFLASGDLPPIGPELTRWAGTTPGEPDPDLLRGSGCETVDWSKVEAESRSHRTYLLSDSSSRFGLDEVIITTADEKAATKLAEKVRDGWKSCSERQLTATVAKVTDIKGPGAKSIDVEGWSTEVTQKADDKTTKYRVGVVAAGPKVTFLFLNPLDDLDLTTDQFDVITLRSGQRASQVN
ncbi:MAG TPA: hypothetical protein VM428_02955 [Microlunatus sp.]|nr:hypothetical protein [Microlunatus sp.]